MEAVLKDNRFAHVARDPRFRKMPKGDRKVKIDKRFKDMFKDKKFKLKYTVDARGRPVNLSTSEHLKKFYELTDSEDSEEDEVGESTVSRGLNLIEKDIVQSDSENSLEEWTGKTSAEKDNGEESDSDTDKEKSKTVKTRGEKIQKTGSVKKKEKRKSSTKFGNKKNTDTTDSEKEIPKLGDNKKKKKTQKEELIKEAKVLNKEIDYARGEGVMDSSSSDDDDDSDDSLGTASTEFDHKWNEQDENIEEVSEATRRIAMCNMDWDRINAKDIFFILSSFKPAQGIIKSVKIYPSEFGKERMNQERLEGPKELKELKGPDTEEEEGVLEKEGAAFQTEKLRQYQLLRLKYYYAVVECDSPETADHIYRDCDGKEYESSSTKIDLRFIPDDMEFEDEPTSMCTEIPVDYKPNFFINTALSQSKVDLTWDETDRDRTQKIAKQFEPKPEDLVEDDLNAYLASSSDEEGNNNGGIVEQSDSEIEEEEEEEKEEEKQINKYKLLLQEINQEEKKKKDLDVQMEITWEPGLKEATEEIVKKKKESKGQTPWEDYLQRKKEKKRQRQLEKKHQRVQHQVATVPREQEDEEEEEEEEDIQRDDDQAFSDDELPAGIDLDDSYFAEEFKAKGKTKKGKVKKKKTKKLGSQEMEEDVKEKEALSLLVMGEEDNKKHFNLKNLVDPDRKKRKKKKDKAEKATTKKDDDFQVNVQDPRFSAMYDSHLFNIDPSAPEFRKTKGTEAIVEEKLKRSKKKGSKLQQASETDISSAKKRKFGEIVTPKEESLAALVNSVKIKTKGFKSSKLKSNR